MTYKLVAIDLDDTLLADDLIISPQTIEAIQQSVKKGVIVTLATGRMFQSAAKYAKEIEIDVPIITYQGAYVKNVLSGEILYQRLVPNDLAEELIPKLKAKGEVVQIYLDDQLYVEKEHPDIVKYSMASGVTYHVVDDLLQTLKNSKTSPIKMLTINSVEKTQQLFKEFHSEYGDRLHITTSKPNYLEFTHPEASKGQAIKHLANQHGITMEEVIAIGDSYNDRDMIEMAGLGVVMENGHPDIKALANYITKSNNDHGVWEVLQKFILKDE